MIILGVNAGSHDASAAVIRDGEIVCLVEAERILQAKRALYSSPALAIRQCLQTAEVSSLDEIDVIALGWEYPCYPRRRTEHAGRSRTLRFLRWAIFGEGDYATVHDGDPFAPPQVHRECRDIPLLDKEIKRLWPKIRFIPHHLAHAASGAYASGFQNASVIVADGRGERDSLTVYEFCRGALRRRRAWGLFPSLGTFYGVAAEWAGLGFWGTGKLMGLAAYGQAVQQMPFRTSPQGYSTRNVRTNQWANLSEEVLAQGAQLKEWFELRCFPFQPGSGKEPLAYADFAASVQKALEDSIFAVAQSAMEAIQSPNLVLTGGVAMNCSLIGRLCDSISRNVYVPACPYDAGVALGAALLIAKECGEMPSTVSLRQPYQGLAPVVANLPRVFGAAPRQLAANEKARFVARRLSEGAIVGWFQGRAEVGQRALGARSILADPRRRSTVAKVNELKGREMWRPLAPSVLSSDMSRLFVGSVAPPTDYMLAARRVRPHVQRLMPANVHVDGTARPQRVRREWAPEFWNLIASFKELTGVPAVLNTSFNLAGEPIVLTPDDAWRVYERSSLDLLILDDLVYEKGLHSRG